MATLLVASFAVLLWTGGEIDTHKPPMPDQVVSQAGQTVYTRADIERGRQIWQSIGGMQLGSIWAVLTLLPLGTVQLLAAIREGYWYARSENFMQQPRVDLVVWVRAPGDLVFAIGALALAGFVAGLWLRPKHEAPPTETDGT